MYIFRVYNQSFLLRLLPLRLALFSCDWFDSAKENEKQKEENIASGAFNVTKPARSRRLQAWNGKWII